MPRASTGSVRFHRGGWEGSVMLAGRRRTVGGKTAEEVHRLLAHLGQEQDSPTLGEFLTRIWLPAALPLLKPSVQEGYTRVMEKRWVPALGHVRLDQLKGSDIQRVLFSWQGTCSGGTALSAYRPLHRALGAALRLGYLERHPCDAVEAPRAIRKRSELWNPEQVRHFLTASRASEWHTLWAYLIGTGCRRGEALALRWASLDLKAGTVRIG